MATAVARPDSPCRRAWAGARANQGVPHRFTRRPTIPVGLGRPCAREGIGAIRRGIQVRRVCAHRGAWGPCSRGHPRRGGRLARGSHRRGVTRQGLAGARAPRLRVNRRHRTGKVFRRNRAAPKTRLVETGSRRWGRCAAVRTCSSEPAAPRSGGVRCRGPLMGARRGRLPCRLASETTPVTWLLFAVVAELRRPVLVVSEPD